MLLKLWSLSWGNQSLMNLATMLVWMSLLRRWRLIRLPLTLLVLKLVSSKRTNLMKLRSDYKDAFVEKHGVKLGFMSGFVKAAVSALRSQPIVNAVIDGNDIIYRDYVDISIAVGTPKGLVVPVLHGTEDMNFADIEKEINTLAKKATSGTISIDEMAGGTFTISNGGVYGSLISTPIVNPPQAMIPVYTHPPQQQQFLLSVCHQQQQLPHLEQQEQGQGTALYL